MTESIRPNYMTIEQACRYTGLSRTRIYEILWCLKAKKCGRRTIIPASSLDEYMQSLPDANVRRRPS
jgi:excisionase family DNA binding protein